MKKTNAEIVYLKDYKKPDYLVEKIDLVFELDDFHTQVTSLMTLRPNYPVDGQVRTLVLNGEHLELVSLSVNGQKISDYELSDIALSFVPPEGEFTLEIINTMAPEKNKALSGLYKSNGIFCTQCESEGFRRITYYLDRPDVLAKFTTTIIAEKSTYPILLSNGNPVRRQDLSGGRHLTKWEDPFPKPSYLFALVAGQFDLLADRFKTASGREVTLEIYVDPGNREKSFFAMESLKKSMIWDEERFGLEYDLDIYMIVAVDSFNMGAMENKGLNIFNSSCVLADMKTATDNDFFRVEQVVGHEYFHNWTGNRVTCRDWFQLTLKEGLTVFRDQEFSCDLNSREVVRLSETAILRTSQFTEDAGPMSHPIRPQSYKAIDNFYTSTVYRKGAEVIRMIHTLLGESGFQKGMKKYFELYDGQAVTTEDFLFAMSKANGDFDFDQFSHWYHHAGTPKVKFSQYYDQQAKTLRLEIEQAYREDGKYFFFPLKIGLIAPNGDDYKLSLEKGGPAPQISDNILLIKDQREAFVFGQIDEAPVVSFNRGFSAPIVLENHYPSEELAFLMGHDKDFFGRFEAGKILTTQMMLTMIEGRGELKLDPLLVEAFGKIINDQDLDPAFKAELLIFPSESELYQAQKTINVEGTFEVVEFVKNEISRIFRDSFLSLYLSLVKKASNEFSAEAVGNRALKNVCLAALVRLQEEEFFNLAYRAQEVADNMTDELSAFEAIVRHEAPRREEFIEKFFNKWRSDQSVINKWFRIQSSIPRELTYHRLSELLKNEKFDKTVPNIMRSVIYVFSVNLSQFHHSSGRGYQFIADWILDIDQLNPTMSASLLSQFKAYSRLNGRLREKMGEQLLRIKETPGLSKNASEIVEKILQ